MENAYYFLNFKRVLVVLTHPQMRRALLDLFELENLDLGIKFVDSYLEAAGEINENIHDPYDYMILNTDHSNKKLKDFLEFIGENDRLASDFVINFTRDNQLILSATKP